MAVNLSRSKYGNRRVEEDGYTFDSEMELRRYRELRTLEEQGAIEKLICHPRYELRVNGVKVATYVADFEYIDFEREGEHVVEDVKGAKTAVYKLKKKLVEALYGFEVTEVKA